MKLLLIFLGGGLGSCARFLIMRYFSPTPFNIPLGTLLINGGGSFLIGIFLGLVVKDQNINENLLLFLTVGFCGGFTTFSAFAFENFSLLRSGDFTAFALYTSGSLLLTFAMVFLGFWVVKAI